MGGNGASREVGESLGSELLSKEFDIPQGRLVPYVNRLVDQARQLDGSLSRVEGASRYRRVGRGDPGDAVGGRQAALQRDSEEAGRVAAMVAARVRGM